MRLSRIFALVVVASFIGGCVNHKVRFLSWRESTRFTPRDSAVIVDGSRANGFEIAQLIELPHKTAKQKHELFVSAIHEWTAQLGSDEYAAVGILTGTGNAHASTQTLRQAMTERAARLGGDVVLIINSGVSKVPYSYTVPGHTSGSATTNYYGNTAYTDFQFTSTPSRTYSGVRYFPYGKGIVFRYAPRVEDVRQRMLRLDDALIGPLMDKIVRMEATETTYEELEAATIVWLEELEKRSK